MLLINPAQEKFGGFLSRYVPVGIPLAIGSLAAYLKKHGVTVRTVDEELIDITPSILRELTDGLATPYFFGLSCLTAHVSRAYQLAEMIKTEFPTSIVIAGGIHPTILPEEVLNTRHIDYVVRGEGEETLLQLYNALRGGSDPTDLRGISFKQNGQIIHNSPAPLISNLDDIPLFPYSLFNHPKYDLGFTATSRGCPYKCTYCSQRLMTGTIYRYKSNERVIEELDILINQYKQTQIGFFDDNFCINRKRVIGLCNAIIELGLHKKCNFTVQTRADNFSPELVQIMVKAGFNEVAFGLETGVNRLGEIIQKGETVEQHLEAIELAKKYGMKVSIMMIFGLPTETREDRITSFNIVRKTKAYASKYNNLIPYPGTPIYNDVKDSDRIHIEPGWSNFNSTLSVTRSIFDKTPLPYVPKTTSEFELKRDIIKYNLKTYVTPRSVISVLFSQKSGAGWYSLPEKWFLKPQELLEMAKIGIFVFVNMLIAFLPLVITEPIMTALNPAMKRRERVPGYTGENYHPSGWDMNITKETVALLKTARKERKQADMRVPKL